MNNEIADLEKQLYELTKKLHALRQANSGNVVDNYEFATLDGNVSLLDLFGDQDQLLMIHNMGQACRYCTLWADGINGFLPHLESAMSVVLVSKDGPELQRRFANSRNWRYRLASHGGGKYAAEQGVASGEDNMPGVVLYSKEGDVIRRKNSAVFGPGDLYCSIWNLLALAGLGESNWTPQYRYWTKPEKMEDGGANLVD